VLAALVFVVSGTPVPTDDAYGPKSVKLWAVPKFVGIGPHVPQSGEVLLKARLGDRATGKTIRTL